ncbi:MAG: SpoIIE family protein phosphatase [Phycisphaerae bacterium]
MKRAHILLVDDDPGLLHVLVRLLSKRYDVTPVAAPSAALAEIERSPFDLALLDLRMPEMSGFELLTRLKSRRPDLDVIIMTGSVNELDAQLVRAIRAEAYYFIQKPFDREVLQTLVERCVELRRLREENRVHTQRLERELDVARRFQLSLLPPEHARVGELEIWARYLPREELCGDYYDYAACEGGACVIVADVSGHGASAAMLTGVVKAAFQAGVADDFDPLAVARRVAQGVRPFGHSRFVTLFCARLRPPTGVMEYVNAGHPPAVLWRDSALPRLLESNGPLIGSVIPGEEWTCDTVRIQRGERLLAITDGLLEAEGRRVTPADVAELAVRLDAGTALLDGLSALVDQPGVRVEDDVTLLAVSAS